MVAAFIAVKDFETFQHYKGRTPPWIKFYNALLDDYRFLQLSDAARSQLMLIWLVASRHRNRIPNDEKYIAEAIHCTSKLQLGKLVDSGWIYFANDAPLSERKQTASKPLADCPQNALLEKERELEIETEEEKETAKHNFSSARTELIEKLPDNYKPDLEAFLRGLGPVARQLAWIRNLDAKLTGMHPPIATPDDVGSSLRQMVANGTTPNWKLFEGYLRRMSEPEDQRQSPQSKPVRTNDDSKGRGMLILGSLRSKRVTQITGHGVRYSIPLEELEPLDTAAKQAIAAIGGLQKVATHPEETFSILSSQFAAMYSAALTKPQTESAA